MLATASAQHQHPAAHESHPVHVVVTSVPD